VALADAWPRHKSRVLVGVIGAATLGLAPYYPHAHIWKQLVNVARGTLTEPIDVLDLLMHGAPWVLLFVVAARFVADAAAVRREKRIETRSP
jgi:hypothetical protein